MLPELTFGCLKSGEHSFRHHPQRPVELNVAVNAAHGTGMRSPAFCTPATEPTLNQVLLNTLVCGPQVIALILPAPGEST